ncbi:DUF2752 domain-containing protein [Phycicoccus sp. HDW14]|uniref:DUF2752 domain-containing protein n=1 Tax=Phycicoccus sp. HDW14 TaxID=2714941 RepID=UPI00140BCCE4|nr:DUF2752 domain-containing protein [Phycicoccus sp. HDW14]QIM21950.1 DUF2752 domain-containing protein [Phycicoccus sp. HDW14]
MSAHAHGLGGLSPRVWWAAAGVAAAGSLAWLATHDPNQPGHYPTCLLLQATGYYCPACGGTRATYDLLHGDVAGAFARHPLVPPLYLAVAAYVLYRVVRARQGRVVRTTIPNWLPVAIGVAVIAFGVLRNLPGWEFLSPA